FNYDQYFQENQNNYPMIEHYIFIGKGFTESLSFQEMTKSSIRDKKELEQAKKQVSGNDLSVMIYTSGTTGKTKGVMITHLSIIASDKAKMEHFIDKKNDVAVGDKSVNHLYS